MKKLIILPLLLFSCSHSTVVVDGEKPTHYYEEHSCDDEGGPKPLVQIEKKEVGDRVIASSSELYDMTKSNACVDLTKGELDALENAALRFDGELIDPQDYGNSGADLQAYLEASGVISKFSASEMISPHNPPAAKACGHTVLIPPQCRWPSGAIQGLLAGKLREVINDGDAFGAHGITLRNWYRPDCYNKKVQGAKSSDHIQARGFDLDFSTAKQRAKAQKYLCDLYREKPFSLQVGIGCRTLHIGIGSPKRLPNHSKDGSRFWTYGSLQGCSIKRLKTDRCWLTNDGWNKRIYTSKNGWGGAL